MPQFSASSEESLQTCHPALQRLCRRVIETYDFTVLEGHRGKKRQNKLVEEGRSKVEWPNSMHNRKPSLAVDIAPYPIDWDAYNRFYELAGHMQQAFADLQGEGRIPAAVNCCSKMLRGSPPCCPSSTP